MNLLLLFHRLPYPPNKGEKIRYFHFLKGLAGRHAIRVGCFAEPPDSQADVAAVGALCADLHVSWSSPMARRAAYLRGMLTGAPLSMATFDSASLQAWIDRTMQQTPVDCVLACSAAMGRFVLKAAKRPRRFVMDFVDMDSDKWGQYAATAGWPASAVYRRESRLTLGVERAVAAAADASLLVSATEVEDFLRLVPEAEGKVHAVENGVDADYYDPGRDYPTPFGPRDTAPIVFVGTMDYLPNVDAVSWFARDVMPLIRAERPDATFHVVGARPSREVLGLRSLPGVSVTGAVPDVRPYVAWSSASVAPLRIARGIQNKVLEAMAMAKPVIVTPAALAGIDARPEIDVLLAATEADLARQVLRVLRDSSDRELGRAARRFVLDHFLWKTKLQRLERLLSP
ncbi:MAG: TIGR03087 family PEP-CTERM/XrtA system glycosyltransferase [Alphaproteobacteria bacterium]|nr:TIGR03087 family PEP-CTERM/XrtA system glycosyltransferase [Alphaproteobacteria bacterium]